MQKGKSPEVIAEELEEDLDTIQRLCRAVEEADKKAASIEKNEGLEENILP